MGRWEGDAFVVESAGFNDNVWLDNNGNPATERLRVTERFVRKDFGHMDIEITVDDPKAYTRPWKVTQPLVYQADDELIEYICDENNRYFLLVPDAAPPGQAAAAAQVRDRVLAEADLRDPRPRGEGDPPRPRAGAGMTARAYDLLHGARN